MGIFYIDSGSFGDIQVTGSISVTGIINTTTINALTSSIQYITSSQLDIGTNIVTLNSNTPSIRYGGLSIIDSGSSPQRSGSILFDSQNNQWIFIHQGDTGADVTSSVFIQGPQTFNNVGNETTLTTNRLTKASGGDLGEHIGDSNITDDGTTISIISNTQITGSLTITQNITGSLLTRGLRFGEVLSTPSANENDYSPTGWNDGDPNMATTINISGSTDIKITGLAGGTPGRVALLKNTSTSYLIILEDNSSSSTAGNRFDFRNPIFLLPNGSVTLVYDDHSQKWEPIAASGGIGYGAFFNQQEEFLSSIGIWGSAVNGTAASVQISTYLQNTTEKPMGMWQADTGTTNAGRAHIGAVQATSIFPTLGQAICLTRLAVEALSNATDRYQIFFGWHDAVGTTNVTDGVYWLYDDAASSAWQGATANNTTRTTTGAAGPTVDTNYIWLGIYVNSDWTRATYFYSTDSITWTIAGSQSTNLPTLARNTGFGVTINKTVGTTQRNVSIDYLAHRYDITRG